MLKTIFFDLGNVLIFFDHSKMLRQIAHCTGLTSDAVKNILVTEKVLMSYESGQIDTAGFCQIFKTRAPKPFALSDLFEAVSDIFTPNAALWPLVEQLKEKGCRLILLSNTSECHFIHVYATYPLLRLFDDMILSFEVGALKPDPRIFQAALAKAQCDPKECFYTDDIPEFVAGARKAGLDSEIFTSVPELKASLAKRGRALR